MLEFDIFFWIEVLEFFEVLLRRVDTEKKFLELGFLKDISHIRYLIDTFQFTIIVFNHHHELAHLRLRNIQQQKTLLNLVIIGNLLLNLLRHGESYGYDIIQSLREIEPLVVTDSTVYPVLSRLRRDGYVKVRVKPSSEGPPRRYFSVTELGRERIAQMNGYWDALQEAIGELRRGRGH